MKLVILFSRPYIQVVLISAINAINVIRGFMY